MGGDISRTICRHVMPRENRDVLARGVPMVAAAAAFLVDKLGRLAIHLFDGHLGVADHDVAGGQKTLRHLAVGVDHVAELHLLLPKLLL